LRATRNLLLESLVWFECGVLHLFLSLGDEFQLLLHVAELASLGTEEQVFDGAEVDIVSRSDALLRLGLLGFGLGLLGCLLLLDTH